MSKYPKTTNEEIKKLPLFKLTPEQKALPYAKYQQKPIGDISQANLDALNAGPCNPELALSIEKRSDMFLPGYQAVETGFCWTPVDSQWLQETGAEITFQQKDFTDLRTLVLF